jgi:Sulfotransferase family
MIISHEHKCVLIHIPKTAGSTMTEVFRNSPEFKVHWGMDEHGFDYAHMSVREVLERFGPLPGYTWHAFIRNPYDRIYSAYIYLTMHVKSMVTFEAFLTKVARKTAMHVHTLPMSYFLDAEPHHAIHVQVHQVENFAEEFRMMLVEFGFPKPDSFQWVDMNVNVSPPSSHSDPFKYRDVYESNPRLFGLVNKIYKNDFETFGYDMIEPTRSCSQRPRSR